MKNSKFSLTAVILILIFSIASIQSYSNSNFSNTKFIDKKINEELKSSEYVRVVIDLEDKPLSRFSISQKNDVKSQLQGNIKYDKGDKIVAFISKEQFNSLSNNPSVVSIKKERTYKINLQDSVPLINATNAWQLQENSLNLTGKGVTVCIIDTGINYSHQDLGGCYGENNLSSDCKVWGGIDLCADNINCSTTDDYPEDVQGHGTHISGIVAANGTIKGVAPDARIIMIKAANSTGSLSDSDIITGIEMCTNNFSGFNISVISMSLGDEEEFTSNCDSNENYTSFVTAINAAVAKNISVVISSGNSGNSVSISGPACIQNATPVTSSNKSDSIASYANRGQLVKLVAPGGDDGNQNINSTSKSGSYVGHYGTSMAAPHVSGALAILSQLLMIQGNTKTPSQLEDILAGTGKNITDSTGLNYSRINIHKAIISLDIQSADISLISPPNNFNTINSSLTFRCNASDISLKNATFYLWNSSSVYYNESRNFSGQYALFEINVSSIPEGQYTWNCLFTDENNNRAFSSSNYSSIISQRKQFILIGVDGLQNLKFNQMLFEGLLTNFSRLIAGNGWNGTALITGHASTETAPGNAELNTGLNENLNNVSNNVYEGFAPVIPDNNSTFERLKNFNSNIKTGSVYGRNNNYIPHLLFNAQPEIDFWQNKSTNDLWTDWKYGGASSYSENISHKASEFLLNYSNGSFYLLVYFGVPDTTGHSKMDNSSEYNESIQNVDDGLGIILNTLESLGLWGINNITQIMITADHGWNLNSFGHATADEYTLTLPLITSNQTLVSNNIDGTRKQCDVAPTTLDYFGLPRENYADIINNGCDSMIYSPPTISIISPLGSYSSLPILINISTDEESYCLYDLDLTGNQSLHTQDNLTFNTSLDSLSQGNHEIIFYCNDSAGNLAIQTSSFSYSLPSNPPSSGGSSSTTSGGSSKTTYESIIPRIELTLGTTKHFSRNERVRFQIVKNGTIENHSIYLAEIIKNGAILTISSTPFNLTLLVGESKKLNLSSPEYYDLILTLNNISNQSINLSIKELNEKIKNDEELILANKTLEKNQSISQEITKDNVENKISWILILLILVGIIIMIISTMRFLSWQRKNSFNKKLLRELQIGNIINR
jgi:hypothetical protein